VGVEGAEPFEWKPTAFYVWEMPDELADERQAVLTVLQNVKWQNIGFANSYARDQRMPWSLCSAHQHEAASKAR
jgi:hypothetical protein